MGKKSEPTIKRGDIFLVNFDPAMGSEIKKTRPALVIQNNINNLHSPVTIVAAITSYGKEKELYPTEILIKAKDSKIKDDSIVLLNQIRTVDRVRLVKKIGKVKNNVIDDINKALEISLGIIEV